MRILYFSTYMACLWDTKMADSHKHAIYVKKSRILLKIIPFAKFRIFMRILMQNKHYFCTYLNEFMRILDFGTHMACLWDTRIGDSHKHVIYVPKSRILMKIFTFAKSRILMRILMQNKHYFCTYLKVLVRILNFSTYVACLWDTKMADSHKHAIYVKKSRILMKNIRFAKFRIFMGILMQNKHYFCTYLNEFMRNLDFGTHMACLWDTKIGDSHRHVIYVPKSRIIMKIFPFAKFRILVRIDMQKYHYFFTYLNVLMRIPYFSTYMACLWDTKIVYSHKHAIYVKKSRIRMKVIPFAKFSIFMRILMQNKHYFCTYLNVLMRILDFGTYMACLWDNKIGDSHKHVIYVPKSRILMKISPFEKFRILMRIVMQNKHYFCTYLNELVRILNFSTYVACLWDTKMADSHKHAIYVKKSRILMKIIPFAKFRIFMGILMENKHYFCTYLNEFMRNLDFGTHMACLWDTKIGDSHKHVIYVPKSRIIMKIFPLAKFRILVRIFMQKYHYFCTYLNVLMRILYFSTYMACLWDTKIVYSHKHAIYVKKIQNTDESYPFREIQHLYENTHAK